MGRRPKSKSPLVVTSGLCAFGNLALYIESCFIPVRLVSTVVGGAMWLVSGVVRGAMWLVSGVAGVIVLVVSNAPLVVSGFMRVVFVSIVPVAGGVPALLVSDGDTRPVSGAACPVVLSLLFWE